MSTTTQNRKELVWNFPSGDLHTVLLRWYLAASLWHSFFLSSNVVSFNLPSEFAQQANNISSKFHYVFEALIFLMGVDFYTF
jgi:hypothetical protein